MSTPGRPRRVVLAAGVLVLGAAAVTGIALRRGDDGPATPLFVDEAAAAGIDHVYDGEFPFFVGGGVATFDCNDDGLPEVYLAGGTNAAALYVNRSTVGGAVRFDRLPSPVTDLDAVTGAYPLDLDSDGAMDLVVLRDRKSTRLNSSH